MADHKLDQAAVKAALEKFLDPESGRSALANGQIGEIQIQGNHVTVALALTSHSAIIRDETAAALANLLRKNLPGVEDVSVTVSEHVRPPQKLGQVGLTAKSVIAVGSGKGGVGKSTIAASIAIGLARAGSKVGL